MPARIEGAARRWGECGGQGDAFAGATGPGASRDESEVPGGDEHLAATIAALDETHEGFNALEIRDAPTPTNHPCRAAPRSPCSSRPPAARAPIRRSIPRLSSTYHHGVFASPPAWGDPYGISWASDGAGFPADSISPVAHLGRELVIDEPAPADPIGPSSLRVRWSGCGQAPLMLVLRAAAIDLDRGDVVEVLCRVEDDGELTIPDDAMRLVDPSWIAELSLVRTVQRTHGIEGGTLFTEIRTVDTIELGAAR